MEHSSAGCHGTEQADAAPTERVHIDQNLKHRGSNSGWRHLIKSENPSLDVTFMFSLHAEIEYTHRSPCVRAINKQVLAWGQPKALLSIGMILFGV